MKVNRASFSLEKEYIEILEAISEKEHRSKTAQLRHMIMEYAKKTEVNIEDILKETALAPA